MGNRQSQRNVQCCCNKNEKTISYHNASQFELADNNDIVYCYLYVVSTTRNYIKYIGYMTQRDLNLNEKHFGIVYYKSENVVFFPSRANWDTTVAVEKYHVNIQAIHDSRPNVTL